MSLRSVFDWFSAVVRALLAVAQDAPLAAQLRLVLLAGQPAGHCGISCRCLGQMEQAVYDKYACWCEKTTGRKASAIEAAKVPPRLHNSSRRGTVSVP